MSLSRLHVKLKVLFRECPGCGYQYTSLSIMLCKFNLSCGKCGKHKFSEFKPVYAHTPLKPKRQQ